MGTKLIEKFAVNWRTWITLGYSVGNEQSDDKSLKRNKHSETAIFATLLMDSDVDMPDMRCFSISGMKNQNDAVLESFGATEEIIFSLNRLPSTN